MATRKAGQKDQSDASANDLLEQKLAAFAEQLGSLVGTVEAKAEGWLDRKALSKAVVRIRDSAADLLDHVNRRGTPQRKTAAKPTLVPAARVSRGPVDAPGKHHRKPPPQERIDRFMGEPTGKQMGQKSVKTRGRGGF